MIHCDKKQTTNCTLVFGIVSTIPQLVSKSTSFGNFLVVRLKMATTGAGLVGTGRDNDFKSSAYTNFDEKDSLDEKSLHVGSSEPVCLNQQGAWQRAAQSKYCRCFDITTTVVIIALVWMMIALPTIMYLTIGVSIKISIWLILDHPSITVAVIS